jgi:hypothetical protein
LATGGPSRLWGSHTGEVVAATIMSPQGKKHPRSPAPIVYRPRGNNKAFLLVVTDNPLDKTLPRNHNSSVLQTAVIPRGHRALPGGRAVGETWPAALSVRGDKGGPQPGPAGHFFSLRECPDMPSGIGSRLGTGHFVKCAQIGR